MLLGEMCVIFKMIMEINTEHFCLSLFLQGKRLQIVCPFPLNMKAESFGACSWFDV